MITIKLSKLKLDKTVAKTAISRAMAKTSIKTATELAREITTELNMLYGLARKGMDVKTTPTGFSVQATNQRLGRRLVKGGYLAFSVFKPRQTKQGVQAKVFKRGGPKKIRHGFMATMPSGHKGAFIRKRATDPSYKSYRGKNKAELKILESGGANYEKVASHYQGKVQDFAVQQVIFEIERQMGYLTR